MTDATTCAATDADVVAASRRAERLWIIGALLAVYLIWSSTYLAIRYALESYPPFLMAALRFIAAGGLMIGVLAARGEKLPTRRQWKNAALIGTLLLAGGNGLVCYAQQTVASGLAAVMVASMPLWAALFAGLSGKWPNGRDWLGLAIGFSGVALLTLGGDLRASPAGTIALLLAPICWALGSVWSRSLDLPKGAMATGAQMLTGGAIISLIAAVRGEALPVAPTLSATLALIYLIVFGSIVAFTAYMYLLRQVRPALATSYAYVNPPVAVLLGVALAGEQIGGQELIGMGVILAGVVLILLKPAAPR